MAFSYNPSLSTPSDMVRLYIGDTVQSTALYSDEEIAAMLTAFGDPMLAAAALADGLAAKFSRSVSFAVEGLRIENSVKAENYRQLALRLRSNAALAGAAGIGVPFGGGLSVGAMDAADRDTDRPDSQFRIGMNDDRSPRPDRIDE